MWSQDRDKDPMPRIRFWEMCQIGIVVRLRPGLTLVRVKAKEGLVFINIVIRRRNDS